MQDGANAGFAVNGRDVAIGLLYDDENGVALGSFGGWEKMGTVLIPTTCWHCS